MDDRRGPRWAAAAVLSCALGCAGLDHSPFGGDDAVKIRRPDPNAVPKTVTPIQQAREKPYGDQLSPATLVAMGNCRAEVARKPDFSDFDREHYRSEARKAYQAAIQVDPKHVPAYVALAKLHLESGDTEACVEQFRLAVQHAPNDANLWFEYGLTRARMKDFDGAMECLNTARKLDPDHKQYAKMTGLTLARMGRTEEAYPILARAMGEPDARYALARMAKHVGQTDAAREQVALALRAHPVHAGALMLRQELDHGGAVPVGHAEALPAEFVTPPGQ